MRARAGFVNDDPTDKLFQHRLALAAKEIRAQAAGRTCGSCQHFAGSWCALQISAENAPLKIYGPEAVACEGHTL